MSETDTSTPKFSFKKNGDIVQNFEGTKTVVAHYDVATGHLEYATREASTKLVNIITQAVGTINKGTTPSGRVIKTVGVKGVKRDTPTNVPPKPRRNPQYGDNTPELVEWYFQYYPQEAYIRYGVYLDTNGNPIRKDVARAVKELIDDRDGMDGYSEQSRKVGHNKWEKGPIGERTTIIREKNAIIAKRGTHMTFIPNEVVGGFDLGDEDEEPQFAVGEDDEGGEE